LYRFCRRFIVRGAVDQIVKLVEETCGERGRKSMLRKAVAKREGLRLSHDRF